MAVCCDTIITMRGTLLRFAAIVGAITALGFCDAKVKPKITCDNEEMVIELSGPNLLDAYFKGLKNYPEPACLPNRIGENGTTLLRFRLSLLELELFRCGTSQTLNKLTGSITYYNTVILIDKEGKDTEFLAKCKVEGDHPSAPELGNNQVVHHNSSRLRRDVLPLPAGFEEQEVPIFFEEQIGYGPEPILSMVVKQEGRTIGQELLVQPGAPLTMEVSHIERKIQANGPDDDVYGIIVSKLDVTDNQDQSEVIVVNGCSVDSYLFENFVQRGEILSAKFRAFKFPDSTYVLFKGTINVCLGSCQPTQCSNGQFGYGRRRRRSLKMEAPEINGVYEVRAYTILRVANPSKHSELDDGTILYRNKRVNVNVDDFRLADVNVNLLSAEQRRGGEGSNNGSRDRHSPVFVMGLLIAIAWRFLHTS